ncbi:sensor histidine kinase [Streptosporangium sp. CA-135522]|uniref:sensor histidine kinase n=1 Tax=Streptosporangium sp. CA-135522 TaxID=3240072 RepID=UPI003D926104
MFLTSAEDVRPGWIRSRRDWAVATGGFVLALAGAVAVIWDDLTAGAPAPRWHLVADLVAGMSACAVLWLCRRWPVAAGLAVVALSVPAAAASVAAGIATLIAALYRRPLAAIAVGAAGVGAMLVRFAWRPPGLAPYPVWALVGVLFGGALTGWGMLARTRRELVLSLAERARRAEADQRLRAEQARRAERVGIAREMHDVLAHRLSLLALHAGALEFNAEAAPGDVAAAAGVIRSSAHLALQELRTVISVLRDAPDPEDHPLPRGDRANHAALAPLIEESRQAGMRVDLLDHGIGFSDLPAATGRAAFRIVQEGLTNARKHAPGQPVTVVVSGTAGTGLTIEVSNPLPAATATPRTPGEFDPPRALDADLGLTGAGAGLAGLAERASLAGGRLEHGSTANDGFRLEAWLPWPV